MQEHSAKFTQKADETFCQDICNMLASGKAF